MDPLVLGLAFIAIALLLIVVEIFIPSAGLISLVAGLIAIVGIVVLFRHSVAWGFIGLMLVVLLGPITGYFALQIWPNTPMGRKFIHGESGEPARQDLPDEFGHLIGAEAVTTTDLRPVGKIRVDDQRFDALSEVSYIPVGTRVRITSTEDNQIRVRPIA